MADVLRLAGRDLSARRSPKAEEPVAAASSSSSGGGGGGGGGGGSRGAKKGEKFRALKAKEAAKKAARQATAAPAAAGGGPQEAQAQMRKSEVAVAEKVKVRVPPLFSSWYVCDLSISSARQTVWQYPRDCMH